MRQWLKTKQIDKAVQNAVYSAQQLLWDKNGKERKDFAIKLTQELLEKAGIKIGTGQISSLIEAAVMEMNIAKGKYQYEYLPEAVELKTDEEEVTT